MVWMEPPGYTSSVAPVFNDLDLQVVAYDGTTETVFFPNNLAAKDPDNTVEMVRIPDVDLYEWFNVRLVFLPTVFFISCACFRAFDLYEWFNVRPFPLPLQLWFRTIAPRLVHSTSTSGST